MLYEGCLSVLQSVLGVPEDLVFESCSEKVGEALGPDVMKSVKPLVPDILRSIPLLLYQGQPLPERRGRCQGVCAAPRLASCPKPL